MRFIDLFAGIGGFHYALTRLGHECVFASEIDDGLRNIYVSNFPLMKGRIFGDIRTFKTRVPAHDILCAGFPCQPFSKSGDQLGVMDKTRGTLFHEILEILRKHRPRYFILENVGNFERHDRGNTWLTVKTSLLALGYDVRGTEHVTPISLRNWRDGSRFRLRKRDQIQANDNRIVQAREGSRHSGSSEKGHGLISPHHLGFPQHRGRFFAVGSLTGLPSEPFPPMTPIRRTSLETVVQHRTELNDCDRRETSLTSQQRRCIELWNDFVQSLPSEVPIPSFPIWSDEFGAVYPYQDGTPFAMRPKELRQLIVGRRFPPRTRKSTLLLALPSYARDETLNFKSWKIRFIGQNRKWFSEIREYVSNGWLREIRKLPPSLRKFEWNAKGGNRNLWDHVLQFRPSGLRVKRYSSSPALVAMTATQIPLLGPERRFLTRIEGLRLQGFPDDCFLPAARSCAFAALGNAVHVGVAGEIAGRLIDRELSHQVPANPPVRVAM